MQHSNKQTLNISSNIFEVHGLTSDVYQNGIYRIDFDLHHMPKWSIQKKIQLLYHKHKIESANKKYNIQYRYSVDKIAEQLKSEFPEYFI